MTTRFIKGFDGVDIYAKRAEQDSDGLDIKTNYALKSELSGKTDKVSGATSGNLAGLDSDGNLTDSGVAGTGIVHDASYVHTDNNYTSTEKNKLAGIESGAEVNVIEKVKVNGSELTPDADKAVDVPVPVAGSATPQMDGTASVGSSAKFAREDHVHPTDTSREAVANKTTVVIGSSNTTYPTDKAVADFVNSSVATNTANYISDNGNPFTSLADLQAYSGSVTNNDYAFVTGVDGDGNTYYDRYKATVNGGNVTWAKEYRLNNSSFTAAQWVAISSGITSALVGSYSLHIANTNNPHNVTKAQVGLGNVDNTSDADKPISTATQTALNAKLSTTGDGSNVTVTFTKSGSDTSTMASGGTLSAIFTAISSFFASLKALAFKDTVGPSDVEEASYNIAISGNAATATEATRLGSADVGSATTPVYLNGGTPLACTPASMSVGSASALSASKISSGDLDDYTTGGKRYFCNYSDSSNVTNKPSGVTGAFALDVIEHSGGVTQLLYNRDSNYSYIRCANTGGTSVTWTVWDRFTMASDAAFSAVAKTQENTSNGCTLTFTAIDGSTKSVTVRNVVNAGNADTVDGYHIVIGSTGTDTNTIYFT